MSVCMLVAVVKNNVGMLESQCNICMLFGELPFSCLSLFPLLDILPEHGRTDSVHSQTGVC